MKIGKKVKLFSIKDAQRKMIGLIIKLFFFLENKIEGSGILRFSKRYLF